MVYVLHGVFPLIAALYALFGGKPRLWRELE